MAKTLLQGVNEVLKRVSIIQGASGELASLTDSGKQSFIDHAVQAWSEQVEQLYSLGGMPLPNVLAENTITLATDDRDYALETDLVRLHWPLLDETNGRHILEYSGGYMQMVRDQFVPSNYTGLPLYGAIRPTDGELYLDRIPTSDENGLVYKYRYEKDVSLSVAADTFPFDDAVFRAMVPAVSEVWKRHQRNSFDEAMYRQSIGRALRYLRKEPQRESWLSRAPSFDPTDPFHA